MWNRLHGEELVARTANGHEPHGILRVALDLAADVGDVQVGRPRVADVLALPEVLHDLPPREDPAGVAGEEGQELQLRRGQLDRLAVRGRLVPLEVEVESADVADRVRLARVELPPPQ